MFTSFVDTTNPVTLPLSPIADPVLLRLHPPDPAAVHGLWLPQVVGVLHPAQCSLLLLPVQRLLPEVLQEETGGRQGKGSVGGQQQRWMCQGPQQGD